MRSYVAVVYFAVFSGLTGCHSAWASTAIDVSVGPTDITVYSSQASVVRRATVTLPAGDSVLVFKNLPTLLVSGSEFFDGKAEGQVTIGAITVEDALEDSPEIAALKARDKKLDLEIQATEAQIAAAQATLAYLAHIAGIDPDKLLPPALADRHGFSPTKPETGAKPPTASDLGFQSPQLENISQFLSEIYDDASTSGRKLGELRAAREDLVSQHEALTQRLSLSPGAAGHQAKVAVHADTQTQLVFSLSYRTRNAFWHPAYEARLDTAAGLLTLSGSAAVAQNTGEDWNGVKLTLSSADPTVEAGPRPLTPIPVGLDPPEHASLGGFAPPAPAPLASPPVAPAIDMRPAQLRRIASQQVLTIPGLTVSYALQENVSIPSDTVERRFHVLDVQNKALSSVRSNPRAEPLAYMQEDFKNTSAGPLLPGPLSVYSDEMFLVHSSLPLLRPGEDTQLGFGPDSAVSVVFAENPAIRSEGGQAWDKLTTISTAARMTLRNFHDHPVDVVVQDQAPVSTDPALIVAESFDPQPAASNSGASLGLSSWTVLLKPGEEKTISHGVTLTAPEGSTIRGPMPWNSKGR